ncbi:hypothetical protein [Rhodopila sp.]|uniref:hypothetical protein n=1 Tax=Rhodopila sp. TaxID=2480087 RepID=UPI003D0E7D34
MQTVSIDEMTGIQALERAAKRLPMKSGHIERPAFEYIRHAQADRDRVLDPGPRTAPPWQLHNQGASPAEDLELDRLLQCHNGKAVLMDNEKQAAGGVTCSSGF